MLKFEIETLDGLDDTLKPMYAEAGGKYRLKVEGIPAPKDEGLAERLAKLESNNKSLLAEKLAEKERAERLAMEAAKKGGDVEALEKSWSEKLNTTVSQKDQELNQYQRMIESLTVGATASTFAAEVFGEHAELMMPHVSSRLKTEIVDGNPKVRVLTTDGKPSAMSIDDLKQEFRNNNRFAALVVGSRASGGVPAGHYSGGGMVLSRSAFDQLPPRSRSEFIQKGGTLTES